MNRDEILQLAETCGFDSFTPEDRVCWECWEEQLLKFANAIYNKGQMKGFNEGTS
jgi:hypothetical protein